MVRESFAFDDPGPDGLGKSSTTRLLLRRSILRGSDMVLLCDGSSSPLTRNSQLRTRGFFEIESINARMKLG